MPVPFATLQKHLAAAMLAPDLHTDRGRARLKFARRAVQLYARAAARKHRRAVDKRLPTAAQLAAPDANLSWLLRRLYRLEQEGASPGLVKQKREVVQLRMIERERKARATLVR